MMRFDIDVNGCWLWTGDKTKYGYGRFYVEGRKYEYAHRMMYRMAYGGLSDDDCVLHRCDVPACVNPAHLRKGSRRENTEDMIAKDRHRFGGNGRGVHLHNNTVAAIRSHAPQYSRWNSHDLIHKLMDEYRCSYYQIHRILTGKSYKWVKA